MEKKSRFQHSTADFGSNPCRGQEIADALSLSCYCTPALKQVLDSGLWYLGHAHIYLPGSWFCKVLIH